MSAEDRGTVSHEQRVAISGSIASMSSAQIGTVIEILREDSQLSVNDDGEINIDIAALSNATVWALQDYIDGGQDYVAWRKIWRGLLGGDGARKLAVGQFADLHLDTKLSVARLKAKQLLGPLDVEHPPWALPNADAAAHALPRDDPEQWATIDAAVQEMLDRLLMHALKASEQVHLLAAFFGDTYAPARLYATRHLGLYKSLIEPPTFDNTVSALLTDTHSGCRLAAVRQVAVMAPPGLIRHQSAVGQLQADVDANVRVAASAIVDRMYAPLPEPSELHARGAVGEEETPVGYAAAQREWQQQQQQEQQLVDPAVGSSQRGGGEGASLSSSSAPAAAQLVEDTDGDAAAAMASTATMSKTEAGSTTTKRKREDEMP
jgi:hypothetical protein